MPFRMADGTLFIDDVPHADVEDRADTDGQPERVRRSGVPWPSGGGE